MKLKDPPDYQTTFFTSSFIKVVILTGQTLYLNTDHIMHYRYGDDETLVITMTDNSKFEARNKEEILSELRGNES